jgi:hypothetical protein
MLHFCLYIVYLCCHCCLVRLVRSWPRPNRTNRDRICSVLAFSTDRSVSDFWWPNFQSDRRTDQFGSVWPNAQSDHICPKPHRWPLASPLPRLRVAGYRTRSPWAHTPNSPRGLTVSSPHLCRTCAAALVMVRWAARGVNHATSSAMKRW